MRAESVRRRGRTGLLAIACLATISGGCELVEDYDQRGGPAIAAKIRAASSPIVTEVFYLEGDYMDAASVHVTLRAGTPEADALALVCEVIVPTIQDGDPPEGFSVALWDRDRVVATDLTPCL
jgi:hypothetical protein